MVDGDRDRERARDRHSGQAAEAERVAELVSAEMVGAADLDPPLAVDAGIGPNWLAAK